MNTDKERKKKKGKRLLKRKAKKGTDGTVEEVASLVNDLKVDHLDSTLHVPEITVTETQSQPGSRRSSTAVPVQLMINPGEVARRASDVGTVHADYMEDYEYQERRRDSITRRGSVKRGSISYKDEEKLETKRLKAALDAMGVMKKAQKEFTWDSVSSSNEDVDITVKR